MSEWIGVRVRVRVKDGGNILIDAAGECIVVNRVNPSGQRRRARQRHVYIY